MRLVVMRHQLAKKRWFRLGGRLTVKLMRNFRTFRSTKIDPSEFIHLKQTKQTCRQWLVFFGIHLQAERTYPCHLPLPVNAKLQHYKLSLKGYGGFMSHL